MSGEDPATARPFTPLGDSYESGAWPFGPRSHDTGWGWMFDMAVVGVMLDARPGDRVLDLGSGTGFATETLVRFGYRVVALDPDLDALRQGRKRLRLDRRLDPTRACAVGALAQGLPFRDASFDGVVGMNVAHHFDDLEGAFAEIARVLKPGARAAFSEPGTRHLESAQTRRAMRELGEDDKPLDIREVAAIGWRVGFERVELRPLPHPGINPVELRELADLEAGAHHVLWNRPEGLAAYAVEYHPLFVMVREGARPRDSRHPGVLAARLDVEDLPASAARGQVLTARVEAANTGDTLWLAGPRDGGGHVTFGVKLLGPDGRLVDDRLGRARLAADVPPGGAARATLEIPLPADLAPGTHRLGFDMVAEWMRWFSDDAEAPPVVRELEIS